MVHLQDIIFLDGSVDGLPFVSLGKSPIAVTVPVPV